MGNSPSDSSECKNSQITFEDLVVKFRPTEKTRGHQRRDYTCGAITKTLLMKGGGGKRRHNTLTEILEFGEKSTNFIQKIGTMLLRPPKTQERGMTMS